MLGIIVINSFYVNIGVLWHTFCHIVNITNYNLFNNERRKIV